MCCCRMSMEIFLWITPQRGLKAAGSFKNIWRKMVKSRTPLSYLSLFLDRDRKPDFSSLFTLRFLCLYLPANAVILSFLLTSGSPDTPPSTLGFATMKCTLTHTGSLCLCCYSNLAHALHPHQVYVIMGGGGLCVSTSGISWNPVSFFRPHEITCVFHAILYSY